MNSISISKEQLSLCHKGTCVTVEGNMAKTIVFGLAAIVVISGIVSMLDSTN
jgi:hypothetical protein